MDSSDSAEQTFNSSRATELNQPNDEYLMIVDKYKGNVVGANNNYERMHNSKVSSKKIVLKGK
jgi:hypothetical protein